MGIHKNIGEIGELLLKATALQCMQSGKTIAAISGPITSLHVGDFKSGRGTYSTAGSCPPVGDLTLIRNSGYKELQQRLAYAGIVKAGTSMKADIQINGQNYSIKSSSARPAIINHTFRSGFLRITNQLGIDIKPLDDEVERYWHVRLGDEFKLGEDVSGNDRLKANVFISQEFKKYFRSIFNHFAFIGTGRGDSPQRAKFILEFNDPLDVSTWKVIDQNTFYDQVWPDLIFSIRDKGKRLTMPKEDEPWAQTSRDKIQAQLHVRAG